MTKVEFPLIQALVATLSFKFARVGDTTVTGCWAFLPNGFKVGYGESACVDPNNFDFELGKKYAKERCVQAATNKLWELEGYLLKVTGSTSDRFVAPCGVNDGSPVKEMCPHFGFTSYESKPVTRFAYEVKQGDSFEVVDETTMAFVVGDVKRQFKHYEPVKPGDFIVFLKDDDVYHCRRDVFTERNYI
ncbi:Gp49 family protein [Photobacterium toruni]|uniref:Gp49 family protein n=1 Tax=Photobacterium toruni TaxID=1935446 RepID=UPI0021109057|nr:Gp49 family protein [Photobacterium toruni]